MRRILVLLAILVVATIHAIAQEPPALIVEAPASLAASAARVRGYDPIWLRKAMLMTGQTTPGDPIVVRLVEEDAPEARAAPPWANGYAPGGGSLVILIPSRAEAYPHGSLEALLHHEVTHVLIDRSAGDRHVPRWFHEGVAMAAARERDFEDRTRLVIALLPGRALTPDELDARFGSGAVHGAYALAGAMVLDLIQQHGEGLPADVLTRMGRGASFDDAFVRATGLSPQAWMRSYYARQTFLSRWLPVLFAGTLSVSSVLGILALVAIVARRRRDAERKRQWAEEEAALAALSHPPPGPEGWIN